MTGYYFATFEQSYYHESNVFTRSINDGPFKSLYWRHYARPTAYRRRRWGRDPVLPRRQDDSDVTRSTQRVYFSYSTYHRWRSLVCWLTRESRVVKISVILVHFPQKKKVILEYVQWFWHYWEKMNDISQ